MSAAPSSFVTVSPHTSHTFHGPDGQQHTVTADDPFVATERWQQAYLEACPFVQRAPSPKTAKAEEA